VPAPAAGRFRESAIPPADAGRSGLKGTSFPSVTGNPSSRRTPERVADEAAAGIGIGRRRPGARTGEARICIIVS